MKKHLLLLLSVCMLIISFSFTIVANAEKPNCIIRGENVTAMPNTDVTLTLTIENNPGISGAEIIVSFDERLTLVNAVAGDALSALTYVEPSYYRNPTIFLWDSEKINDEDIKDGIILSLTFHTPSDVADVDFPVIISYEPKTIFDKDLNPMDVITMNGCITSISYLPGDADGNGRLNTLDITAIRRYISDGRTTDPNGYNVAINENAADVDGNGRINTLDITKLRRYISDGRTTDPNGYNITLVPGQMACSHNLIFSPEKTATCTENGNIAFWQCNKCDKYYSDAEAKYEISLASTTIYATGHLQSQEWSYNEEVHWHKIICEHKEDNSVSPELIEHTFNNHICTACGYVETHSVTFVDYNGNIIASYYVAHGNTSPIPETPKRNGYRFDSWAGSLNEITADTVIRANYVKQYSVIFKTLDSSAETGDNLETISEIYVDAGTVLLDDNFPTQNMIDKIAGYDFDGWSYEVNQPITQNTIIIAKYKLKKCAVTFVMPNGTVIATQTVAYGLSAEEPQHSAVFTETWLDVSRDPRTNVLSCKMNEFSGWDTSLENIRDDIVITAKYDKAYEKPVICLVLSKDGKKIEMGIYNPKNCYIYAINFGFSWKSQGSVTIDNFIYDAKGQLYDSGVKSEVDCQWNNKEITGRVEKNCYYTMANIAGCSSNTNYMDIGILNFAIGDGGQPLNQSDITLFTDCELVYGITQNAELSEFEKIIPMIVIIQES